MKNSREVITFRLFCFALEVAQTMSRKTKKRIKEPEQRCLCGRCATTYQLAGYDLERDYTDVNRHPCDICKRDGWLFIIYSRKKCF